MDSRDRSNDLDRRELISIGALTASLAVAGCSDLLTDSSDGEEVQFPNANDADDTGENDRDGTDHDGEGGWELDVLSPDRIDFGSTVDLPVQASNRGAEPAAVSISVNLGSETVAESEKREVGPDETERFVLSFLLPELPLSTEITVELTTDDGTVETYTTQIETLRTVPDATFVVAKDGSGDYDDFDEAARVGEPGDVILMKEGIYTGTADPGITLVGSSPEDTTFVAEIGSDGETNLPAEYWNLTLETNPPSELRFDSAYERVLFHNTTVVPELTTADNVRTLSERSEFRRKVILSHLQDSGSTFGDDVRVERTHATRTRLRDSEAPSVTVTNGDDGSGSVRIDDSHVGTIDHPSDSPLEITGSTFDLLYSRARSLVVDHSTVTGSIEWKPEEGGRTRILHSEIRAEDQGPIAIDGGGILELHACEIRGKVRTTASDLGGTITRCEFRSSGLFAEFIEGAPARTITKNIFDGADIWIDSGDVRLYDERAELGNYYSEWDGAEDGTGDGISDRPRPVPGEGEVTDKFPLMEADLSTYL